jgi:hypothetical protein
MTHSFKQILVFALVACLLFSIPTRSNAKDGAFGVAFGQSTQDATDSSGNKGSYRQLQVFLNEVISGSNKMELSYSSSTGPKFTGKTLQTKIVGFDYFVQQGGTGFYARLGVGYSSHEETIGTRTVTTNEFIPRIGAGYEWVGQNQFGIRFELGSDIGVGKKPDQNWSGNLTKFSIGFFTNI